MGTLLAIEHLTLDGVMQAPARPDEDPRDGFRHGGWAARRQDPAMQEVMGRRMASSWSLLVGRTTYQQFAGFWPQQPSNPFTDSLNAVQKYVVSGTLSAPLPWENSTLLGGEVAATVAGLKKDLNENLVVFGSGVLVRSLLEHHLVDELLLMVHPLTLGSGRRLFADTSSALTEFLPAESTITEAGVVMTAYRTGTV
jgi:dihydrofolate reductase